MEHILNFFSDLILFTAGLMVILFWIIVIIFIIDELIDMAMTRFEKRHEEDENA